MPRLVQHVPGWPVTFRGSAAIAAGLVTRKALRGPRYRYTRSDVLDRPERIVTRIRRALETSRSM